MIIKNEEEFLEGCLKSAEGIFDEVIVADTGSTDDSVRIAQQNGASVFDFQWCDDFSAARNFAAEKASNDWVFVLDADEKIRDFDREYIENFVKNPFNLGNVSLLDANESSITRATRLYNRRHYEYSGRIHEQIVPIKETGETEESEKADRHSNIIRIPVLLEHYGYSPEVLLSKSKLTRNEHMLLNELADNPNDPYILYQLGKSFFAMSRDLNKACDYFKKALAQNPDVRLEYAYSLVECYGYALINTKQYEKALELVELYSQFYQILPHFRFLKAHVYQNNGMFIEAVECYESCIGANAVDHTGVTSFLSYYNIGVIVECLGMIDDAKEMYKRCGDYAPAVGRLEVLS